MAEKLSFHQLYVCQMLVVLEYKYRILCEELLFPYDSYVILLLPLIAQGFI